MMMEPQSAKTAENVFIIRVKIQCTSPAAEKEDNDRHNRRQTPSRDNDLRLIHHAFRKRRLFATTDTLETDMAVAATIGLSSHPVNG